MTLSQLLAEPTLFTVTAMLLILIGLGGALLRRNLIKMVLGFTLISTGSHVLIISLGYVRGGTAPIIDDARLFSDAAALQVASAKLMDPVPQALVLTAIVIGVGVTALMLAYVVRIYARRKSLDVNELGRLKW